MREAAADRAPVADRPVRDLPNRLGEKRRLVEDEARVLERRQRCRSTDPEDAVAGVDE
jgi:hypothetical protein